MNIVFFGTSEFAVESLRALLAAGHTISLVVTQPDRRRGRNLALLPTPVKALAEAHGLRVYQPADASSSEAVETYRSAGAELFVVIAYGQILKQEVLSVPKRYAINLHGSLLPAYRGAAPINRAVMSGDTETGVTIIRLNERMDEGDIIAIRSLAITPDDTSITMSEGLSGAGAELLVETVGRMVRDEAIDFKKQDPAKATRAPKLSKESGRIRWEEGSVAIHNAVRGLLPWPGAYTLCGKKTLKILKTVRCSSASFSADAAPGTIVGVERGKGIIVRTGDGALMVTHIQLEGGKELDVDAFLRGHRLGVGDRFV